MMRPTIQRNGHESGLSLLELMVVLAILGMVMLTLMGIAVSTSRLHWRTSSLAGTQLSARQGMSLMETEIRQAGADPANPPIGVVGVVTAQATLLRVRGDLDGNGVITTTEPSEDVIYSYDAVNKNILRNPGAGAQVVVPDVSSLAFTYYDGTNTVLGPLPLSAANASLVRAIGVNFQTMERDSMTITLSSRIYLRNRG
ncbi:MAG: PilW family protein [Candidatus Eiseniibacteriota bacterium]